MRRTRWMSGSPGCCGAVRCCIRFAKQRFCSDARFENWGFKLKFRAVDRPCEFPCDLMSSVQRRGLYALLAQRLFHSLELVDVLPSAVPAYDLAGWSVARRSTSVQLPLAIHSLDPMHNIDRLSCVECFLQRLHRRSHLFRAKHLQPSRVARLFTTHSR